MYNAVLLFWLSHAAPSEGSRSQESVAIPLISRESGDASQIVAVVDLFRTSTIACGSRNVRPKACLRCRRLPNLMKRVYLLFSVSRYNSQCRKKCPSSRNPRPILMGMSRNSRGLRRQLWRITIQCQIEPSGSQFEPPELSACLATNRPRNSCIESIFFPAFRLLPRVIRTPR